MDHIGLLMRLDLLGFQAQLVDVSRSQLYPIVPVLDQQSQSYLT